MAENEIVIRADRSRVWDVLADADTYAEWVVGADRVRDADTAWPEPGSRLHHSVGVGPLTIDDSTEVVAAEPPSRLELLAHLGPLGSFAVELRLEDVGDGTTRVTMFEEPVEGISRAAGPVGDAFGRVRNKLSLARLKALSER
ncbi:MAG TPA: SRPBCC family protein [Gaiellaceae bacterium]